MDRVAPPVRFDPAEDLPPDGAEWRGTIPGLPGERTWTFNFPYWSSDTDEPDPPLLARAFDPAGQDIARRWTGSHRE